MGYNLPDTCTESSSMVCIARKTPFQLACSFTRKIPSLREQEFFISVTLGSSQAESHSVNASFHTCYILFKILFLEREFLQGRIHTVQADLLQSNCSDMTCKS